MPAPVRIENADLSVTISPVGAQMTSIRDKAGREWLWPGDPQIWPRQAPTLFPVVAQVYAGEIRHRGARYPMSPHGFAPTSIFSVTKREPSRCQLTLEDDEETRRHYPFSFRLDLDFTLSDARLDIVASISNPGTEDLPASLGFHPGFRWPLPTCEDLPQEAHILAFSFDEPPVIRRTSAEGLLPNSELVAMRDRSLALSPELFIRNAVIFERIISRSIWYGVPGRPGIRVDLGDMPTLAVWSRTPGRFLCLEPWQGLPDPLEYTGELAEKPGMVMVTLGGSYSRRCTFAFGADGVA